MKRFLAIALLVAWMNVHAMETNSNNNNETDEQKYAPLLQAIKGLRVSSTDIKDTSGENKSFEKLDLEQQELLENVTNVYQAIFGFSEDNMENKSDHRKHAVTVKRFLSKGKTSPMTVGVFYFREEEKSQVDPLYNNLVARKVLEAPSLSPAKAHVLQELIKQLSQSDGQQQ